MCYHGSKKFYAEDLESYYKLTTSNSVTATWKPVYHENGFDHAPAPVVMGGGFYGAFQLGIYPVVYEDG
jgi:acyl-CoA synthetase (AMP-forming)/AMP-acid ligase II